MIQCKCLHDIIHWVPLHNWQHGSWHDLCKNNKRYHSYNGLWQDISKNVGKWCIACILPWHDALQHDISNIMSHERMKFIMHTSCSANVWNSVCHRLVGENVALSNWRFLDRPGREESHAKSIATCICEEEYKSILRCIFYVHPPCS